MALDTKFNGLFEFSDVSMSSMSIFLLQRWSWSLWFKKPLSKSSILLKLHMRSRSWNNSSALYMDILLLSHSYILLSLYSLAHTCMHLHKVSYDWKREGEVFRWILWRVFYRVSLINGLNYDKICFAYQITLSSSKISVSSTRF